MQEEEDRFRGLRLIYDLGYASNRVELIFHFWSIAKCFKHH